MQAIANVIDDHLQTTKIAVTVFPTNQSGYRSKALDHCGAKVGPVAAVDQHAETRGFTNRTIILEEAFVFGLRVIGRKSEDAVGARLLCCLCHLNCETLPESDPG